jgi:DNA-3-methyladenine glycosylase II
LDHSPEPRSPDPVDPVDENPTFVMHPVPPFRLDLTAWALRRLPGNEMDLWDGTTYRRALTIGEEVVRVNVTQMGEDRDPRLQVTFDCDGAGAARVLSRAARRQSVAVPVRATLTDMLGLDVDLGPFYRIAATDRRLDRLARRFLGLKPPRFPSLFEGLVNGVACQQLSLNVGITLLNRLTAGFGWACQGEHSFPCPQDLAVADAGTLRAFGFSERKAKNIVELARSVDSGELDLGGLSALSDSAAVEELDRLKGVGRWTAQYVALRGLGRLDVFPADDVSSRKKIKQWLSLDGLPGYDETNRQIAGFRPYRGLIYFHLLVNSLAERGLVSPSKGEG